MNATAAPLVTEAVAELIALAAAMAANDNVAFEQHNARLEQLGVGRPERIKAVNIALQIKMSLHQGLMNEAELALTSGGGCCGGDCGGDCECTDEAGAGCGSEDCGCKH